MLYISYSRLSWWLIRLTGLLLVSGIFYDIEITIVMYSLIITHFKIGLEAILNDYIHEQLIYLYFTILIRFLSLELIYFFSDILL
uniref:Succinate:cytochrome c oxidoreductase subunit 4 n=1 Tax=Sirodotia delicatula TaxID=386631 RepID=A0A343UY54_9FLOR|nr:succinate:cytochrome c oxidoreductase subunit 4 [Sirodotia delicatula]AVK39611.1 succinate:cytochrome c oxidoreductase subunit 4 [Sirodotia delicatula]